MVLQSEAEAERVNPNEWLNHGVEYKDWVREISQERERQERTNEV